MSTKSTIKHEHDVETGIGFHLFTDWLDECAGQDLVHLALTGVSFSASAGALPAVAVAIPRAMAERLGLVPPGENPTAEPSNENAQ